MFKTLIIILAVLTVFLYINAILQGHFLFAGGYGMVLLIIGATPEIVGYLKKKMK